MTSMSFLFVHSLLLLFVVSYYRRRRHNDDDDSDVYCFFYNFFCLSMVYSFAHTNTEHTHSYSHIKLFRSIPQALVQTYIKYTHYKKREEGEREVGSAARREYKKPN